MENLELIEQYRQLDKELADYTWLFWVKSKEGTPSFVIPTAENQKALKEKREELLARAKALETPDEVYAIWKSHFTDFANALDAEGYFKYPAGPISTLMWRMQDLERGDSRTPSVKFAEFLSLAGELPGVMEVFFARADELGAGAFAGVGPAVDAWEEIWDKTEAQMKKDTGALTKEEEQALTDGLQTLHMQLAAWKKQAEELIKKQAPKASEKDMTAKEASASEAGELPDEEKTFRFEESYYRHVLHDQLGVELDELLSWYEEEMEKTRAAVFKIARSLDIPENDPHTMKEVNDILFKYEGPCDSPEEMFCRGREYLDRAQKAARAYVWMPSDEYCGLVGVPESLKFSYPWGGYEGGDGRRRPIYGQFFLNNYNYKAVTDGWIKMQAVHEAYPGHHVQYVRRITDFLPETAEIGSKYIPMIEGMAHRSEHLFEFVYPEDPFYPLFVAYRRHHTAVRIKADLMLRYFGNPIKDIVKLYMDELGFDYNTARGQIKAQENMEGYFTCYYYGVKKLSDWEKQYGFDEKTYTELLFSAGNISLENFERFLKLGDADRKRYCTLFYSKYKNPEETFGRE